MESLFGKEIEFHNILKRKSEEKKRYWKPESCGLTKGLIIGVRTLWNGYIIYEAVDDDSSCAVFIFENPVKVYLVAINLKENPVYVSYSEIS